MADDGKVIIELVGKDNATQAFVQSLRNMEDSLKHLETAGQGLGRLGSAFDSLRSHWLALAGAFGGGYLITKGIREMVDSFKSITEAELSLEHLSTRLGASTRDLSGLQFAAERSGLGIEQFNMATARMVKNISQAALEVDQGKKGTDQYGSATGKAAQALRELGLNAKILNDLPLKEKYEALSEAMKKISSDSDKVRIAMALTGAILP